MSDKLVINFGSLAQAASDIQNAVSSMNNELDSCEQAAQPLVATWQGAAQDAYHVRQAKWREASQQLNQMLSEIKRAVEDSAANFQSAENRNRALFQ